MWGSASPPSGGGAGTQDSEALAHLVSRASQATYIEPSVPIRALPRGPPCTFPPTECHCPGSEMPGLSGRRGGGAAGISASAEPRRAGQSGPHLPSSFRSFCRCSDPGALRLRTFHSSFYAPSPGEPVIGSAEPDVTTSFPRRLRPSPFPG